MSKIKDIVIDVIEKIEAGDKHEEIVYYISHTYDIPYDYEVRGIISQIRSTMNFTNDCVEEFAQRF